MEEFITEIQNNIGIDSVDKRVGRFRELFHKIIVSSSSKINIINECNDEGDVVFEIPMRSIGVSYETLVNYKKEISSEYAANVIGELLVRENIDRFAKIMTGLKEHYSNRVNKFSHRRFGMKIYRDKFIICFHISLIQSILTEDFRKNMI